MAAQTMQVYNSLKESILNGTYSPSESLKEMDLAQQYKVSRNTIKKCLLMLEKKGLVVIELNKGAKVRSYSLSEVLNFFELRAVLEGFIIKLAVPALKSDDIKHLEGILKTMKQHFNEKQLIEYSKCNQEFHSIIHKSCPNELAVEMSQTLKNQMSKYNTKTILVPGRSNESLAEHQAILDAIKANDADLAELKMKQHILNVRKTFEDNFSLLI